MSDADKSDQPAAVPAEAQAVPTYSARRRSGLIVVVAAALVLATLGGLSALMLRGSVNLPSPLVGLLEDRLQSRAAEDRITQLGALEIALSETGRPKIIVRDMVVQTRSGTDRLTIPRLEVTLSRRALARAEIRPQEIRVDGAGLRVTRRADGFLQLALESGETLSEGPSLPALIAQVDALFERAPLDQLTALELSDLRLEVADDRLGGGITLSGGAARVDVNARRIAIALALDLENAPQGAGASLRFVTERGDPQTRMSLRLSDLPADLLARQSPAFTMLTAFDGAVSARLDGALAPDGALAALSGGMELGAGHVEVPWQQTPVEISTAALAIDYDPTRKRFGLTGLELQSDLASGRFDGSVDILPTSAPAVLPDIQFRLAGTVDHARLTPKLRSDAKNFGLMLEGRLRGTGRRLDLGLVQVHDRLTDARATGGGWVVWPANAPPRVALDLHAPRVSAPRVAQFWPAQGKGHKLGGWLNNNVSAGDVTDASVALRLTRGARPEIALSFGFENGDVRVLGDFPTLRAERGHATLYQNRFLIGVQKGAFMPEGMAPVAIDGSSFEVADTRIQGTDARIRLSVQGEAEALLDVLDRDPIRLSDRVRLPPQGISGRVSAEAVFLIPLRRPATFDLDQLRVQATISDARVPQLGPDLDLSEADLSIGIEGPALRLAGVGDLLQLPVTFAFETAIGAAPDTNSVLEGTARIDPAGLAALGLSLPPGTLSGAGAEARSRLTLRGPGLPPQLEIDSDLEGLEIAVPALGWRKPASQPAAMTADLILGPVPELRSFSIAAAGLTAQGSLRLSEDDRSLEWLQLDRLAVGDWLDVPVELVGRGAGQSPVIAVTGGRFDLTAWSPPQTGGASGGQGPELSLQLDSVIVSAGLALTDVRGNLRLGPIASGTVTGNLNGRAPVQVRLGATQNGRQAIQIRAQNGGAAMAAAGIMSNLQGGALVLTLEETAAEGSYAGRLQLDDTLLVENPAAVEVLSALSIVGLVEQLATGGITLSEVSADLSITPQGISLRNGLANGPSLGMTFEGVVIPAQDRLDLQGVVSPFYLINSLGGGLLGTPREGLIGVTYRVQGTRAAPNVTVNPLSVLTPGIFRDLFRRPPPQLTQ